MPCKNPITIFGTIFRPLLLHDGIWDQLRSDHGTEFVLIATVQHYLAHYHVNQQRLPVLQTTSRQNHRAERIWPEVNSRVNYPIKSVLVRMEAEELIDMQNEVHKFSVSWVTIRVIASPIAAFVSAWNSHTVPGRNGGIPDDLATRVRGIRPISSSQVPSLLEAVNLHETTTGRLTRESGVDPLDMHLQLKILRERDFFATFTSMPAIFSDIAHGNGDMFAEAILMFTRLSLRFSELVD